MGSRAKSYRCCWGKHVRAVVAGEAGRSCRFGATVVWGGILRHSRGRGRRAAQCGNPRGPRAELMRNWQAPHLLELYQRYAGIGCEVTNSDIRLAYEGLGRQALLYAAKLDPAAVAKATEITMPKR